MTTNCVRPRRNRSSRLFFAAVLSVTLVSLTLISPFASAEVTATSVPTVAVAPQYDTTHVYVPAADFDRFVASLLATFGGRATPKGTSTVTPTQQDVFTTGPDAGRHDLRLRFSNGYSVSVRCRA